MCGDSVGRDQIIKNYTHDLAVAQLSGLKLRSDLLDENYSRELILSGNLPNNRVMDTNSDIFKLSKKNYSNEVSKLFNLHR